MAPRTLGYVLFTGACLAGAAVLVLRGIGRGEDDSPPMTAAPATRPAVANVPVATTPPPPIIAQLPAQPPGPPDATAAIRQALAAAPRLTSPAFIDVIAKRPWRSRFIDRSARPLLTPPEIRRVALWRPTTHPVLHVRGVSELPPLATARIPDCPEPLLLPTGGRFFELEAPAAEPLIRLPLVLRARPEPLPQQGAPILSDRGAPQFPPLPPLRLTALPDTTLPPRLDRLSEMHPSPISDADAPVQSRALLARDPLPASH